MGEHAASLRAHQQAMFLLLAEFDRVCRLLEIPYVLYAGTLLGAVRHRGFIPWDDDLDVLMLRMDYQRFLEQAPVLLGKDFFLQKEFSRHWPMFFTKLRLENTTCLERFHPRDPMVHQGIYMDIFPCDNALDSCIGRKMQFLASKIVIAKGLYRRGYETDSMAKKAFMQLCRLLPMKPFLALTRMGREDSKIVHTFLGGGSAYIHNIFPRTMVADREMGTFEGGDYPIPKDWDGLLRILYGEYWEEPTPEEKTRKQHAVLVDTQRSYEHYENYRDSMKFEVYTRSIR